MSLSCYFCLTVEGEGSLITGGWGTHIGRGEGRKISGLRLGLGVGEKSEGSVRGLVGADAVQSPIFWQGGSGWSRRGVLLWLLQLHVDSSSLLLSNTLRMAQDVDGMGA